MTKTAVITMSNEQTEAGAGDAGTLAPAATLEVLDSSATPGTVCALLTPAIKTKLKDLDAGQILLVRVDDASARLDIKAWCMLTGNVLESTTEEGNGVLSFLIRKESKR